MLEKKDKDNKILMQLINYHKKMTEAAKNKVSRDVHMLNLLAKVDECGFFSMLESIDYIC
jgi:hypothetical protein